MPPQKPPQTFFEMRKNLVNYLDSQVRSCGKTFFIFVYLELVMLSALLHPAVDLDVSWVPKTFFSSTKRTSCIIRMHYTPMALLEATLFSMMALLGYFRGCGGVAGVGCAVYGKTLASFQLAMMGIRQKYYWMFFIPWIVTFMQNWLNNIGEFLLLFSGGGVFEAHNMYSSVLLLMAFFAVQILLGSEVFLMALHGCNSLQSINNENIEWERQSQIFNEGSLNAVFGRGH